MKTTIVIVITTGCKIDIQMIGYMSLCTAVFIHNIRTSPEFLVLPTDTVDILSPYVDSESKDPFILSGGCLSDAEAYQNKHLEGY